MFNAVIYLYFMNVYFNGDSKFKISRFLRQYLTFVTCLLYISFDLCEQFSTHYGHIGRIFLCTYVFHPVDMVRNFKAVKEIYDRAVVENRLS